MSTDPTRASIAIGDSDIEVDFNPTSLRITTSNQFGDDKPDQVARPTAFKLEVELLFDTTETGEDVWQKTLPIRDAATATAAGATARSSAGSRARPSLVQLVFKWGTTSFTGVIESLNETLDYWSSDGVPLRSTVQIGLKGDANAFFATESAPAAAYRMSEPLPAPVEATGAGAPAANDSGGAGSRGVTDTAQKGGDSGSGRGIAAQNGIENMRAPGGATQAAGGARLRAAASFAATGGAGPGASAGFGMAAAAGLSGASGLAASSGIGMAGGGAPGSASGTAGFFAGLGPSKTTLPAADFHPERLLPPPAASAGTSFDLSGKTTTSGGQTAAAYQARSRVTVS